MEDTPTVFGGLVDDLRRRKVFRVAAGYAIVAWVAVEVSSVVVPALRLPEWVITAIVVAALAGFPITVLLAWIFDLSSGGVVRTRPSGAGHPAALRVAAQRGGVVLVVAGVMAGSGYLAWEAGLLAGPGKEQSIAVLPFVDLSEGHDSEYFSDGIAEELLNSLVGMDGLRVAARTSSFAFKGRQEDVREIGRQLNVRTVLEGSVRRSGNRVRITAQLIDVDNGFHLWSSTYDRELDDIFRIQDEIAHNIAGALKLELIGDTVPAMAGRDVDIRAYDLYLLGRHHWHQRTEESLDRALELFQEAAGLDPEFALAHTGIADAWLLLAGYGDVDPDEAARRAETAVARALALETRCPRPMHRSACCACTSATLRRRSWPCAAPSSSTRTIRWRTCGWASRWISRTVRRRPPPSSCGPTKSTRSTRWSPRTWRAPWRPRAATPRRSPNSRRRQPPRPPRRTGLVC